MGRTFRTTFIPALCTPTHFIDGIFRALRPSGGTLAGIAKARRTSREETSSEIIKLRCVSCVNLHHAHEETHRMQLLSRERSIKVDPGRKRTSARKLGARKSTARGCRRQRDEPIQRKQTTQALRGNKSRWPQVETFLRTEPTAASLRLFNSDTKEKRPLVVSGPQQKD